MTHTYNVRKFLSPVNEPPAILLSLLLVSSLYTNKQINKDAHTSTQEKVKGHNSIFKEKEGKGQGIKVNWGKGYNNTWHNIKIIKEWKSKIEIIWYHKDQANAFL